MEPTPPPEQNPVLPSQPLPHSRLNEIAKDACLTTFQFVDSYEHSDTASWNTNIINTILKSLVSESAPNDASSAYKFAVTSTIIQHTTPPKLVTQPRSPPLEPNERAERAAGRRGMHSATGAFWNSEKDGMWNYKHKEETKGFDVIVSIIWISIV